jgi:hypothetical protein
LPGRFSHPAERIRVADLKNQAVDSRVPLPCRWNGIARNNRQKISFAIAIFATAPMKLPTGAGVA